MKLIEDFEKRAFIFMVFGLISTLCWVTFLGLVNLITENKTILNFFGWIIPANFLGFELYFLYIITKGK
jgi:hypothetical protein